MKVIGVNFFETQCILAYINESNRLFDAYRFRQFLSDVFIIDNNTVTLHSVDIIATTAENNHIHGLASVLTINFSAV